LVANAAKKNVRSEFIIIFSSSMAAGADYIRIMVTLTFTPSVGVVCASVNATDDMLVEAPEDLMITLVTSDSMVTLNPSAATVNIIDNDSM